VTPNDGRSSTGLAELIAGLLHKVAREEAFNLHEDWVKPEIDENIHK
jgi:hypothetical protein